MRPIELHVSPLGTRSGTGTPDSPIAFSSIPTALKACYDKYGYCGEIQVILHEGTYPISNPLVLSGQIPCCWQAYGDDTVSITSAIPVEGLRETTYSGLRAWQTILPAVKDAGMIYHTLYVNSRQRQRPRVPREGFFEMESVPGLDFNKVALGQGHDAFIVREGEMRQWENIGDVEAILPHYCVEERSPLQSYDEIERKVTMQYVSAYPLCDDYVERYCRYALENVKEALTEPGLWYIDRPTGVLTYLPYEEETLENTTVALPSMVTGIRLEHASGMRFKNIRFCGFDWKIDTIKKDALFAKTGKLCSGQGGQGAGGVPAGIVLTDSKNCTFENCTFSDMGGYALEIGHGCHHINVEHCEFTRLGGGGIRINGGTAEDPEVTRTHHITVTDCHIHELGRVFHAAIGILSMHAAYNNYSHNHIHDLYYSAISVGWVWGYAPSVSHHNRVEYNELHDIGKGLLSDMGGIYTLGEQPGTELRGNVIYDIRRRNYGGWAIYPDEGSAYILIENNLCHHTQSQTFHQHYGKENIIRNNIFAFGEEGVAALTRPDVHNSFSMYHNIFLSQGEPFHVSPSNRMRQKGFLCNNNLYWNYKDGSFCSGNGGETGNLLKTLNEVLDWEEWQEMGWDRNSIVADPGFADPQKGDFTLVDDTNLKKIGFTPLDLSCVGPREEK